MRRRTLLGGAATLVAVTGIGAAAPVANLISLPQGAVAAPVDPADTRTFAFVERGDLSEEREFRAVVSFGDRWTLITDMEGTVTQHHDTGTVVDFGEVLVRVNDRPLFLARGSMPMYRELAEIDTRLRDENGDRLKLLTGSDVAQLQSFLMRAGHDADGSFDVDGTFGPATEKAVERWQTAVGLAVTGRVDNRQLVFSPDSVRIAATVRVGDRFQSLEVNNASPAVLVDTSNRDRSAFEVGDAVEVELPNEPARQGEVEKQEQVTAADGSTTWRTTITVAGDLPGDAASATVTVRTTVADDVLILPVGALLALAEGGFAVEVETDLGTRLVGVDVGEVLDGQAEVDGDIVPGDRVVVAQ